MRPRTARPAISSSNGVSTANGRRRPYGLARNAARHAMMSPSAGISSVTSSITSSAAPGRSSGSSSGTCPKTSSTQAWNAVPRRASGAGRRGIGRARSRASPAGSERSRTTWEAVSACGSSTVRDGRRARRASSNSSSTSRSSSASACRSAGAIAVRSSAGNGRPAARAVRCVVTRSATARRRAADAGSYGSGQSSSSIPVSCGLLSSSDGLGAHAATVP